MIYIDGLVYRALPAFEKDNIAVVFECSELFVPYLSVALASLIACTSTENNYDIIVLGSEIKKCDEVVLCSLCNGKNNISIRFFDPTPAVEKYIKSARYHYLAINYYRMSLPWILNEFPKVINLGADLIVERDIAELFREPMQKACYLAGAPDLGYHGKLIEDISPNELSLSDPYSYINADVLLFDLERIRRDYRQDALMEIWQKKYFRHAEQDALNVFFDRQIHHLDLRWNVFPEQMSSERDILHTSSASIQIWHESLRDPCIIHYAGEPKPWDNPHVGFGDRWWYYAKQSPYYGEIVRRINIGRVPSSQTTLRNITDKLFPKETRRRVILKKIIPFNSFLWRIGNRL